MVLTIWAALFLISAFAPVRWSMVAFLCLSVVDFESGRGAVGGLNMLKGLVLPVYLLWRLRRYSGHQSLPLAPIGWLLLVTYVGVATTWSLFPESAEKLVVQMSASFLIACVFIRATKGGFLTAKTAVTAAIGCVALGLIRSAFFPKWGDDPARFTGFTTAQAYAALLAACYCIVLCGKGLRTSTRIVACSLIAGAIVMDGSRIWFMGILLATLLSLLLSKGQVWLKICAFAAIAGLVAVFVGASDYLFKYVAAGATGNRIASAVTALHQGDRQSTGLGTFNFRRAINDEAIRRLKNSSALDLLFGRGTCNGAIITGTLFSRSYAKFSDPNRMFHNEWLRVIYEWGLLGSLFWLLFIGSTIRYAIRGFQLDPKGNAKPLLVYLPAFLFGLAGENIIAGAATAANMGLILTVALSTVPHREFLNWKAARAAQKLAHNRQLRQQQMDPGQWAPPIQARSASHG